MVTINTFELGRLEMKNRIIDTIEKIYQNNYSVTYNELIKAINNIK